MNKKCKNKYNYEQVCIYFNLDNAYQKECYDLLNKIQKKKSLFLGLLAHNFLSQFKEEDRQELTTEDLKNYIQYYEIMKKKKEQLPVHVEERISSSTTEEIPEANRQIDKPEVKEIESKESDIEINESALLAIKAFKF